MLQMSILARPGGGLCLPTRIKSLQVDPIVHTQKVKDIDNEVQGIY